MSRLVVVSNRVAPVDETKPTSGGLAVAVLAALKRSGGIWFGWSGDVSDVPDEAVNKVRSGRLTYATFALSTRDHDEYYNGFANSTLWPLFHYRLDLANFSRRNYTGYRRVNAYFARKLIDLIEPDDIIWVHDYHLIPMAEELRRAGVANRIGFFLHTPLPPLELLLALPEHQELMRSFFAYDLIGFQTAADRRSLLDYAIQEAGGEMAGETIFRALGRTASAEVHPIGVDTDNIERLAAGAAAARYGARLRTSLGGRRLIVGVDRLDYSKGLPERFMSFGHLLNAYPANRNRVSLMQIATPTRTGVPEYVEIRRTLETLAGHINGEFADFDWVPIRYLNKSFARRTLFGLLRTAQVGLITPLRDGMNLVAMEYVASQAPSDPGVLVLSRFAGAAHSIPGAIAVNPYDTEGVAEAVQLALDMPREERVERWQSNMEALRRNDVNSWREAFVSRLAEAPFA